MLGLEYQLLGYFAVDRDNPQANFADESGYFLLFMKYLGLFGLNFFKG